MNIICGDCLEELPKLATESIQLIITSPPYGLGKEYEGKPSLNDYLASMSIVTKELYRLLKPSGSICWQTGNWVREGQIVPLDAIMFPIFRELGMQCRNRIIWTFGHGLHCKHRFSGRHETILWMTKSDDYIFNLDLVRIPQKNPGKTYFKGPRKGQLSCNPLGKNPGDVWDVTNVKYGMSEKTEHPCQFPESLIQPLILAMSNVGDIILDPFAGSGTVGAVAEKHGRSSILIEKEQAYIDIIRRRCNKIEFSTG